MAVTRPQSAPWTACLFDGVQNDGMMPPKRGLAMRRLSRRFANQSSTLLGAIVLASSVACFRATEATTPMALTGQRVLLGQRASPLPVASGFSSTQQRRHASKRVNTTASERVKPASAAPGRKLLRVECVAQRSSKPRDVSVANHQHYGPVSLTLDQTDLACGRLGQHVTLLHQSPSVEHMPTWTQTHWCSLLLPTS